MDKKELNKYFWLQHEIKKQENRLKRLRAKKEKEKDFVADTVGDYRTGKKRTIKIEGIEQTDPALLTIIALLELEIEKNIQAAEEKAVEIEKFIQQTEDPKLREILRSRFLDCLSWEQVGKENYINADYARRLVRNYLTK